MPKTYTCKFVQISIANGIEIRAFQLPDNSYLISLIDALTAIGLRKEWLTRLPKHAPKQWKALQDMGYTGCRQDIKIDEPGKGSKRAKALTLLDVYLLWLYHTTQGNPLAIALVGALAVETLERRIDAAFGVQRNEEERKERAELNFHALIARQEYTRMIKEEMIEYGTYDTKSPAVRAVFAGVTKMVNIAMFNRPDFQSNRSQNMNLKERQLMMHFEGSVFQTYEMKKDLNWSYMKCLYSILDLMARYPYDKFESPLLPN